MTAYLRPALRQTRFFSRSGLTRHLGLLYRTVQPTIVLFLLVLALTGCLSEEIPTEKETTLVRVGEEAPHNRGETQQTVQEFCRELGIAFSVGLDPDMSIYSLYATRYVPRNFIISPNGKILLSETDYDATIQRLLIEQIEQALQTTE